MTGNVKKSINLSLFNGNQAKNLFKSLKYYVYALCYIDSNGESIPFYIGKGVGDRCLQHLREEGTTKAEKISKSSSEKKFTIDILRHGLDEQTAKIVEATCIDLVNVDGLENKVRGSGVILGRLPLEELYYLYSAQSIKITTQHRGLLFILNKTYKSGMTDVELYEATCGVWRNVPRTPDIKYAYASYHGIIKEVYVITKWQNAGTYNYTSRNFNHRSTSFLDSRYEFVGDVAQSQVRDKYKGKLVEFPRSYGSPFVKVGF